MQESLSKKVAAIKWANGRKMKFSSSLGVKDAYKFYTKNRPSSSNFVLNREEYSKIIQACFEYQVNQLVKTGITSFPYGYGELVLVEYDDSPRMENGQLVLPKRIDWKATLELWVEDEEEKKKKTLIRHTNSPITIKYKKPNRTNRLIVFVRFRKQRSLKKVIADNAMENKLMLFRDV